jgi:hypothetical protein
MSVNTVKTNTYWNYAGTSWSNGAYAQDQPTGGDETTYSTGSVTRVPPGYLVKGMEWSGMEALPAGTYASKILHVKWKLLDAYSEEASGNFSLYYSLDAGANWTTLLSRNAVSPPAGFTDESVDIGVGTDETQVRVRGHVIATGDPDYLGQSITAYISDIWIDGTTAAAVTASKKKSAGITGF